MKYKGRFKPKNPDKYIGNVNNIIYRSMWELCMMFWCDKQTSVIAWGSEVLKVPYISPIDKRVHIYYVDFIIKFKNGKILAVEVKPAFQTKKPVLKEGKRMNKRAQMRFNTNIAKWAAAGSYAEKNGWEFKVWTEKELARFGILKCPVK